MRSVATFLLAAVLLIMVALPNGAIAQSNDTLVETNTTDADLLNVSAPRDRKLQEDCDTPSPTECEKTIMWLVDREWEQQITQQVGGGRRLTETQLAQAYTSRTIQVYFHALAQEKTDIGVLTGKHTKQMIKQLNKAFAKTPFNFKFKDKTLHRNNTWHECNNEQDFRSQIRVGGRDTLNIFVCDMRKKVKRVTKTFSVPTPLAGKATFPHEVESFTGGLGNDGVMIRGPDPKILEALVSARVNVSATTVTDVQQTLVHEVGHWMGLLHTFEGGCSSKFNSISTQAVGDGVTDTAAEKNAAWFNKGWEECFKEKKLQPNSCPDNKKNVDPGKDDTKNYMNYISAECMAKEGRFSSGQIARMVAQFERYRLGREGPAIPVAGGRRLVERSSITAVGSLRSPRMLQASNETANNETATNETATSTEFIPSKDLVSICINSAIQECDCEINCYNKFRDLLRDFLPFHEFAETKTKILQKCNKCPEVGEVTGCKNKTEYCRYGASTRLGNRCAKKKGVGNKKGESRACWTATQCKSGICGRDGLCTNCTMLGSSAECSNTTFCDLTGNAFSSVNMGCVLKRELGDKCFTDDSCEEGLHCTGGRCSLCQFIDSDVGCPAGKRCRYSKSGGWRKYYKCQRKQKFGKPCQTVADCNSNVSTCTHGFCRECPVMGKTEGCDNITQYCGTNWRCRPKLETANALEKPIHCHSNAMCQSGLCVAGLCRQCDLNDACDSREICLDYRCQRKKGESEHCVNNEQCRSNDCRKGQCYGECDGSSGCGVGGICRNQFCVIGTEGDTNQRYFNTYDCRLGTSFQRCHECSPGAHWQCEAEQYCRNNTCATKRTEGPCSDGFECTSGKCQPDANGTLICVDETECESNSGCSANSKNATLANATASVGQFCGGYQCQDKRPIGAFCTEGFVCQSGVCNVVSQRCSECSDDLQCDSSDHCFFGRCRRKQCRRDEDCSSSNQVCRFQGQFDSWTCVDCTSDRVCNKRSNGTLQACDLDTNTCVQCSRDDHCGNSTSNMFCRGNTCEEKQCTTDSFCAEYEDGVFPPGFLPKCDLKRSFRCVECLKDDDCKDVSNGTRPFCDKASRRCEPCDQNRGCAAHEFCTSVVGDGVNFCTEHECVSTAECNETKVCFQNQCVDCQTDRQCGDGFFCENGDCLKKECDKDADCAGTFNGTIPTDFCDKSRAHDCVQCLKDKDCQGMSHNGVSTPYCADSFTPADGGLRAGYCHECITNDDCLFDQFCTNEGTCQDRLCFSNFDCTGDQVCAFNNDNSELQNEFTCVECRLDTQCVKGNKRRCSDNTCVVCTKHEHCSADGSKQCDPATKKCVTPACVADTDCSAENGELCIIQADLLNYCDVVFDATDWEDR